MWKLVIYSDGQHGKALAVVDLGSLEACVNAKNVLYNANPSVTCAYFPFNVPAPYKAN